MKAIPLSWKQKWLATLNHHKTPILIFAGFIILVFSSLAYFRAWGGLGQIFSSTDKFAFLVDTTILISVFVIGLKQYYQEWIDSLPNYLTVNFCYNDQATSQLHIKVDYIPLSSLGDMRGQAQSVVQSLNNGKRVELFPMLSKIEESIIEKVFLPNHSEATVIEHHEVYIHLETALNEQEGVLRDFKVKTPIEYLYWTYPFDQNSYFAVDHNEASKRSIKKPNKKSNIPYIHQMKKRLQNKKRSQ